MNQELFAVSTICSIHHIEYAFINSLRSEGLIQITSNNEGEFIEEEQLHELEIYTRWHHDLGINPEGIDAIRHLVQRVRNMQTEISLLKNKLRLYEEGGQFT